MPTQSPAAKEAWPTKRTVAWRPSDRTILWPRARSVMLGMVGTGSTLSTASSMGGCVECCRVVPADWDVGNWMRVAMGTLAPCTRLVVGDAASAPEAQCLEIHTVYQHWTSPRSPHLVPSSSTDSLLVPRHWKFLAFESSVRFLFLCKITSKTGRWRDSQHGTFPIQG